MSDLRDYCDDEDCEDCYGKPRANSPSLQQDSERPTHAHEKYGGEQVCPQCGFTKRAGGTCLNPFHAPSPEPTERVSEEPDLAAIRTNALAMRECSCHGCESEYRGPLLEAIPPLLDHVESLQSRLSTAEAERDQAIGLADFWKFNDTLLRREAEASDLRAQIVALTAERDAMQKVVNAVERWANSQQPSGIPLTPEEAELVEALDVLAALPSTTEKAE